jgi:molybdate transport system regulatory protein
MTAPKSPAPDAPPLSGQPLTLADAVPRLRIRIGGRKLGPGKADLLEAIGRTGSIVEAGRAMGMSHRRAGLLVEELNRIFARPAVVVDPADDGRAELTALGHAILAAYRRLEARTRAAMLEELSALEPDLAPTTPATAPT